MSRWNMTAALVAAIGGALVFPSCKSPAGPSTSVTLTSEAAIDGWVQSDGVAVSASGGPSVGDFDASNPGVGYREFYSFDLSTVPAGSTIDSAALQIYQALVVGQPYTVLGNVIVDHVNIGSSLDASDYAAAPIASNIGTISTNTTVEYKTLEVRTSLVANLAAGRTKSQYRIRFSNRDSNNDGKNDYVAFTDAEDSCCAVNKPPQLVVMYH